MGGCDQVMVMVMGGGGRNSISLTDEGLCQTAPSMSVYIKHEVNRKEAGFCKPCSCHAYIIYQQMPLRCPIYLFDDMKSHRLCNIYIYICIYIYHIYSLSSFDGPVGGLRWLAAGDVKRWCPAVKITGAASTSSLYAQNSRFAWQHKAASRMPHAWKRDHAIPGRK